LKKRLFTPGPTPLPEEVIRAMMRPMIHHRWPEYADLHHQVRKGLQYALQTENDIMILTCSGTGAMEAAVANLHCPGHRVLVVRGGKFGERWALVCRSYGLQVTSIDIPWGAAVDPQLVAQRLDEDPSIKAVYVTLCETSTGVAHDLAAIAKILRSHRALLVVDAISGLCSEELLTDQWQVDVVVSATQKGLMCPPGISFVSLSEAAWEVVEPATLPRLYWDFREMRKFSKKDQTPYTPAISVLCGLQAALKIIQEEGLEKTIERHGRLAGMARAAMAALNLRLFAQRPCNALTAVQVPERMDGLELLRILHQQLGVVLAGGQSELKGKIFRLAHLGYVDDLDVIMGIAALENGLYVLGHEFKGGAGVQAAQQTSLEQRGGAS
jgi:aspartate aminotransferase-like enzyme